MKMKMIIKISYIFIIFTNLPIPAFQYKCGENGNYTSNSTYKANLQTLLASLPSNISQNGFYSGSVGRSPDVVNAMVLCRADVDLETCRACTRNVTGDLETFCPEEKEAYQWNYLCMLRYSHEPIYGRVATHPSSWSWEWENATMVEEFRANVTILLDRLRVLAGAAAGGGKMVAAGNRTGPEFQTIYALVQCTPDMSALNCSTCLNWAMENLGRCCSWRRGGGIAMPSCNLRYASSEFYNRSMLQESQLLPLTPAAGKDDGNKSGPSLTIIIIIVPMVGSLVLAISVCTFLRRRKKQKLRISMIINAESLQYDFETIRNATKDFSEENKLGQGGFGIVYKGKLIDGQEIAVKRLSMRSEQGDLEFKNEVLLVAKLQHKNLVRLLGFCLKETERILVYEFVLNASLDHFIFDPIRRSQQMDWDTRFNIISGIAKGLVYLHEDSHLKIIHRDLKASNVLLDAEMNPKIADFGLARLIVQDKTHDTTSRIAGTYGYMSPEYVFNGHFSIKSDVFSFGVMALEIVSGQKNSHFEDEHHNIEHLLSYAWRNWQSRRGEDVIDPVLKDDSGFCTDINIFRCIHIGLLCVQENVDERPTMTSVVHMINNTSLPLSMPSKPGFFMQGRLDGNHIDNNSRELDQLENITNPIESRNDASITEMCPR